ncbi:hypothetical protein SPRG_10831 [Saprolegnia parasitica CBS 223.65]|uniref:Uncharacterized protein n=1 Tax=Saprolegnia parasitica (strain CBS 223.65) TaxID=695850 RepID=A0A067C0I4_SAPPC|nr:hypothetical protein SPRG_10831 [Saprolegnia parasitica CBS 223.65]KDO24043.1 hypothetical protein SPRG_10831 [Saprolegnia parasitica CBS 223.65]|eukprot:XP_012205180.1 hypothetical protein SPRG_10831 [Saprolegnia parasitica CBS 223.65]
MNSPTNNKLDYMGLDISIQTMDGLPETIAALRAKRHVLATKRQGILASLGCIPAEAPPVPKRRKLEFARLFTDNVVPEPSAALS